MGRGRPSSRRWSQHTSFCFACPFVSCFLLCLSICLLVLGSIVFFLLCLLLVCACWSCTFCYVFPPKWFHRRWRESIRFLHSFLDSMTVCIDANQRWGSICHHLQARASLIYYTARHDQSHYHTIADNTLQYNKSHTQMEAQYKTTRDDTVQHQTICHNTVHNNALYCLTL